MTRNLTLTILLTVAIACAGCQTIIKQLRQADARHVNKAIDLLAADLGPGEIAALEAAFAAWQETPRQTAVAGAARSVSRRRHPVPWFELNAPSWTAARAWDAAGIPYYGIDPEDTLKQVAYKTLTVWSASSRRAVVTTRRRLIDDLYPEMVATFPQMRFTPGVKINDYITGKPEDYDWLSDRSVWQALAADAKRACALTGDDRFYIMAETPMMRYWHQEVLIDYRAFAAAVKPLRATGLHFAFYPLYVVSEPPDELWTALVATWATAMPDGYTTESYAARPASIADPDKTYYRGIHNRLIPPQDGRILCTITGTLAGKESYTIAEAKAWIREHAQSDDVLIWSGLAQQYITGLAWPLVN